MLRRFHWWDRSLWWYTYTPGGYEGYRTAGGRRLPCATLATALQRPDMRDQVRKLARRRPVGFRRWWRIVSYCNLHTGTCSLCEAWKAQKKAKR